MSKTRPSPTHAATRPSQSVNASMPSTRRAAAPGRRSSAPGREMRASEADTSPVSFTLRIRFYHNRKSAGAPVREHRSGRGGPEYRAGSRLDDLLELELAGRCPVVVLLLEVHERLVDLSGHRVLLRLGGQHLVGDLMQFLDHIVGERLRFHALVLNEVR